MAYILLAMAAIFWGGNYVVGHILVMYVDPYSLSLIRWAGTTILMFSVYWNMVRQQFSLYRENLLTNVLLAFFGQVCFPLTLYIGLQYTSPLNAAIYISSTPCLVLAINYFFFREHITARNIFGVLASTAGVLYLAFASASGNDKIEAFGKGDILTIISALSWAFYCAFLRIKNKQIKHTSFVAFSSLVGTLIIIPIVLLHAGFSDGVATHLHFPGWGVISGLLYLIVFPSWLSYVFWNKGVSLIGTTRSEIFTHLIPLSGGIIGIVFLHNQLRYYHIITLVLIVFGIACCSGGKSGVVKK
ncbi:EamA family transporter [Izhakiella australiensis]|uniref:Threonine/homoserine exporter RhtA n=1 Tax=Izhakiella australiensis TaxID=1926881 RepID=A0A1S8YS00_9GAMM|nr:DMT family transporter [Izhakiella australiensis]OON41635.1 EamA family transporter [Izhakiella australiensis]